MFRYARLKHDFQLEEFGFERRDNRLAITPETVPFNDLPKPGKGPALRLNREWYEFVRSINSEAGFRMATGPSTGWVNEGWENRGTPLVQSLSMGGNVLVIREISEDNFGRLRAYKGEDPPPDPRRLNYHATPQYIQKFTCVSRVKTIHNPGRGIDAYFPLIGPGHLWVSLERVELFPALPCLIEMRVTAFFRGSPRKSYFNVIGGLAKGEQVRLIGYSVRASSVWGYVTTAAGRYGYVALLWHPDEFTYQFLTSWEMETRPSIPPKS